MSSTSSYCVGEYRVLYNIGQGTFGRVKLATHVRTGQRVAIKIINKTRMKNMDMGTKLLREISILNSVGYHPHIIRLYELIDAPTDIFVVMEYVPGGELFDYIVQRSRLPEHEARRFFKQIVSGVEYCHNNMVCHRDLKPENVLLENNQSVKIGDFGLSNFMRDGDYLRTSCGSPNYAAPEVVSGKTYIGPEVDVWSCGVILYALLCGCLPFDDDQVPNLFKKIKNGIFTLPGHLSDNARRLIIRMLLVDPSVRITLKEVRRHPWVCDDEHNNAAALMACAKSSLVQSAYDSLWSSEIDQYVTEQLKTLGYTVDCLEMYRDRCTAKSAENLPRVVIAYNLLLDKRRNEQQSFGTCGSAHLHHHHPGRAGGAAALTFSRAARQRHLTASIFHADLTPFGFLNLGNDDFDVRGGGHGDGGGGPGGGRERLSAPRGVAQGERGSPAAFRAPGGGGSCCPPPPAAEEFSKWRMGLETHSDAPALMTAVFFTLRSLGYEWSCINKYRIYTRRTDAPDEASVILCIQVFRLPPSRASLHIQAFDGSLLPALRASLWALFAIYRTLAKQQLSSLSASSQPSSSRRQASYSSDFPSEDPPSASRTPQTELKPLSS